MAQQQRALLRDGKDPIAVRDQRLLELVQPAPAIRTFEETAQAALEARAEAFSGERYRAQWMSSLQSYVLPGLGQRDVAELTAEEVAEVLRPIWTRVPETASRVRQRIEQVFSHAIGRGWRLKAAGNPRVLARDPAFTAKGNAAQRENAQRSAAAVLPYIERARGAGDATLAEVAEALMARGVTAPRGGSWSPAQVRRVLLSTSKAAAN